MYANVRELSDFIENNINIPQELDITNNVVFNNNMIINRNIIVHTGFQLTISATVQLGQGRYIEVERGARLFVNGGTISRRCDDNWAGIYVRGNFNASQPTDPFATLSPTGPGVVVLRNATIEFAGTGTSTSSPTCHGCQEFWGALVDAENSQFINCRRAVEFMKYDQKNRSRFKNCTFTNNLQGLGTSGMGEVTIWDTDGIIFDRCTFENQPSPAIVTWDAGCTITNGCQFRGNQRAVISEATSPISSGSKLVIETLIGQRNVFENNGSTDIELRQATKLKSSTIRFNDFKGGIDGIWMDARNSVIITNNYFEGKEIGITGQFTGTGFNYLFCNDLSTSIGFGMLFAGNNPNTRFLHNQFETELLDFGLEEASNGVDGSIHPSQGGVSNPAHNCFSTNSQNHIWTCGATVPFTYYLPYNPLSCKTPLPPPPGGSCANNYFLMNTSEPLIDNCPLGEEDDEDELGPFDYNDYAIAKQEYLALKAQLDADPGNAQLAYQVYQKEEQKEAIIAWFINEAIATGNVDTAQIILNDEGTYQAKQQLYGLKVQLNDYAGAQAFLNAFPITTQDEQWFKSVQEINLARLQNPANFTLSAVQDSLLQVVALSQSPERGYARSLLSFLKGQLFERDIELPDAFQNPGAPQFIKSPVANHVVAQPNPTTNLVQVAIQEFEEEAVDIILFDFGGKPVRQFSFSGGNRFSLPLEDLPSGIYFLQAANSTRIIGRTKLVVSQ